MLSLHISFHLVSFDHLLLLSFAEDVVGRRGHVAVIVAVVVATHRLAFATVLRPDYPLHAGHPITSLYYSENL